MDPIAETKTLLLPSAEKLIVFAVKPFPLIYFPCEMYTLTLESSPKESPYLSPNEALLCALQPPGS